MVEKEGAWISSYFYCGKKWSLEQAGFREVRSVVRMQVFHRNLDSELGSYGERLPCLLGILSPLPLPLFAHRLPPHSTSMGVDRHDCFSSSLPFVPVANCHHQPLRVPILISWERNTNCIGSSCQACVPLHMMDGPLKKQVAHS